MKPASRLVRLAFHNLDGFPGVVADDGQVAWQQAVSRCVEKKTIKRIREKGKA